jgi:hypothetical protein
MARKVRHAFKDILEAIERVDQITRGKTLAEFWQVGSCGGSSSARSKSFPKQVGQSQPN